MPLLQQLYTRFQACGRRVTTDSRRVEKGALFVALRGDSFDGNRFVVSALEAGAGHAVCDDPAVLEQSPAALRRRITLVDNTLEALQGLAAYHRRELGFPLLAITGTNGKTTTKELIRRVLSCQFQVSATQGNLNNHIGVPLTLLKMGIDTELAVVEMGAGAPGEIALLCRIARPDFGLVTNVGMAHLEGFGNIEGVRRGKGELYDYLAEHGGMAFYRAEDETLAAMVAQRPNLRARSYPTALGDISSRLEGDYNQYNIAAAVAIGDYFDVPRERTLEAIASYIPDNQRSQIVETAHNRLIVDCYNANPSSMRAALENFARQPEAHKSVILGDMLELGDQTAASHRDMLLLVRELGIDRIYLVGEHFRAAARELDLQVPCFADAAALADYLKTHPVRREIVLLKGSRGMKLEAVERVL